MSGFTETNTNTNASALLESATLSFHNIKTEVENEAEVVAHKVAVERSNALETETEVTENIQINKIQVTQVHIAQVNEIQHFGMLKIQAATLTKVLTKMLRIVMIIDLSGSMDEKCKDNRSQIHHMRTVTMNLIRELHKFKDSETNIQFIVKGFERNIHHILNIPNLLGLSEQQIENEIIPEIDKLR